MAVRHAGPVWVLPRASAEAATVESALGLIGRITLGMKRAGVRSAGNPHAAYDVAEAGDGVKGRTEAPEDGESLRPTATPRPCGHRASFRPYRRAVTGNGAMAGSEAPALRKPPATATPIRLPQSRQSPTLPFSATDPFLSFCLAEPSIRRDHGVRAILVCALATATSAKARE